MLLEAMWGLDIQSLSVLGGDQDQALFTFCFVAKMGFFLTTKITTLYVLSYNSKTVEVTGLGIVSMASKLIFASL